MLLQLNPPLPLETPKGLGQAVMVIDYGPDFDLIWVVLDDATGECWSWPNPQIRGVKNVTMGRRLNGVAHHPPAATGADNGFKRPLYMQDPAPGPAKSS